MKIAKLLVLGALFLLGSNVAKAVEDVWQKPAMPQEFASLVDGEIYYFYNVGSQLLFTQGNAWGTQASVGETGLKVKVASTGNGDWTLTDYVKTQNAWKYWWFVDDGISMYVDYNNQPDFLWAITDMGNNTYRLQGSANNPNIKPENGYVGLNRVDNPENTALTANCTTDDGSFIDWKLIPEATGEAYDNAMTVYLVAIQLRDIINEAEAINAVIPAEVYATYRNTGSTVEELNNAIATVKTAIEERKKEMALEDLDKATVANPIDVSSVYLKNTTFTDNKYDGWSGDTFGGYNPKENAEHYNKTYNTYQEISELREGVYKFNVHAFYRAGNSQPAYDNYKAQNAESKYAKIYATSAATDLENAIASPYTAGLTSQLEGGDWSTATDAETGEAFVIPNNMVAADVFFNAGYCVDNGVLALVNDGNLKVGVRKSTTISGDWSIFDDFSLTFYGNGDDAYQLLKESVQGTMKDFGDLSETIYTYSYLEAYNAAIASMADASTKDAILAAIASANTAAADLDKNIELWKTFQAKMDEAKALAVDESFDPEYTEPCGEWAEFDAQDMLEERTATNDELQEQIDMIQQMISDAKRHPRMNADMTSLMVNPNFQQGATGWTKEAASGGNVGIGGTSTNTCYEAWNNAQFDIYQVVENAPMGVYEISVQGFYRYGRTAYSAYLNGDQYTTKETCPVFVYMNSNTTPLTNVYGDPVQIYDAEFYSANSTDYSSETNADGQTVYFPNGMASSAIAFEAGMYTQSAYGLVAKEGDPMRIGVKGSSNQLGDSWSIWDNFKITYKGFQADVVKPVLEQAIADGEASLSSAIGKDVAENLEAAIAEAKEVVNGTDGVAMFEALTKLFDMQEAVNKSKALFAELTKANENLAIAIGNAVCDETTKNEANQLNNDINNGIDNRAFNDTDVEDLINQINKMINRLGIPKNMDTASDASPVECTTVIVNPNYVEGDDHGWTGGAAVNATANDAEKFSTNYDYYQLLQGLPAGTYKVSVQAFYRAGGYAADYESWKADAAANNNAFLYATADNDTVSTPIHRLASQAIMLEALSDGWVWASEADQLAVPNSMVAAGDAFSQDLYKGNEVIVKVGEEGKLTIGMKKNVTLTDDWTIWTGWQLFYYGKNSSLQPSDNPLYVESISSNAVVNAEFFTINGTRVNGIKRGVTIVRETLSDGTVRVRKVSIK